MGLNKMLSVLLPAMLAMALLMASPSDCAPPRKGKVFGPCVGMNCLHGVLMHGDAKLGDAHGIEDAEKQKAELDRLTAKDAAAGSKPGQLNQEEYLHGVLMHGDANAGKAHSHEQAPTVEKKPQRSLPVDQEEFMHGVLMHGGGGHHDDREHAELRADAERKAAGGLPGVEMNPDAGPPGKCGKGTHLLTRWWNALKFLVTGTDSGESAEAAESGKPADYNLLHDLEAVGNTKSVAELSRTAGHSHKDTEKIHKERDRREHASKVHIEH